MRGEEVLVKKLGNQREFEESLAACGEKTLTCDLSTIPPPVQVSVWRPIDTVPKNTRVLVWCRGSYLVASFCSNDPAINLLGVTRWMPLPDPPEVAK